MNVTRTSLSGLKDQRAALVAEAKRISTDLAVLAEPEQAALKRQDAEALQALWRRRAELQERRREIEAEQREIEAEAKRRVGPGVDAWQAEVNAAAARWRQEQQALADSALQHVLAVEGALKSLNERRAAWLQEATELRQGWKALRDGAEGFPFPFPDGAVHPPAAPDLAALNQQVARIFGPLLTNERQRAMLRALGVS